MSFYFSGKKKKNLPFMAVRGIKSLLEIRHFIKKMPNFV